MTAPAAPTGGGSAAGLAARVEELRRTPGSEEELVGLLAEDSPLYAGRGTNEVERLRGYVLAGFESRLPPEAVPFVLEELELGLNPYSVAGAARALRGASEVPAEAPARLVGAMRRLRGGDAPVSFEVSAPVAAGDTTALGELARTLAWLGPRARSVRAELGTLVGDRAYAPAVLAQLADALAAVDRPDEPVASCCHPDHVSAAAAPARASARFDELALEDQDGTQLSFAEAFAGRPTALAFFYTRCTNPLKCSATVTGLARIARRVAEDGVDANVAGISYDPGFDRPARLRTYGADRGIAFSPTCRLLRTVGPFAPLQHAFQLGVGFGPVTVNRHRLDLVVLNASLAVSHRLERRLWSDDDVLAALHTAATGG
jgi:cytochrome oxidase Cu insertion factor (SCO1/SenC/PrrC family)